MRASKTSKRDEKGGWLDAIYLAALMKLVGMLEGSVVATAEGLELSGAVGVGVCGVVGGFAVVFSWVFTFFLIRSFSGGVNGQDVMVKRRRDVVRGWYEVSTEDLTKFWRKGRANGLARDPAEHVNLTFLP
jgi:hypothetical protein